MSIITHELPHSLFDKIREETIISVGKKGEQCRDIQCSLRGEDFDAVPLQFFNRIDRVISSEGVRERYEMLRLIRLVVVMIVNMYDDKDFITLILSSLIRSLPDNRGGMIPLYGDKYSDIIWSEVPRVRESFHSISPLSISLRPHQEEQYPLMIEGLKKQRGIYISWDPSEGKTLMALFLSLSLRREDGTPLPIMIIATNSKLVHQWEKQLLKINPEIADSLYARGNVGEKPTSVPKEGEPYVIIISPGLVHKIPFRWRERQRVLIIDESPATVVGKSRESIFSVNTSYIICCAAIPERRDMEHRAGELMVGNQRFSSITTKQMRIVYLDTEIIMPDTPGGGSTSSQRFYSRELGVIMKSSFVIYRVASFIESLASSPEKQIIVSTTEVDASIAIYNHLRMRGISVDYLTRSKQLFEGEAQVLVGTWVKVSTGLDQSNGCETFRKHFNTAVSLNLYRDNNCLFQFAGRLLRSDEKGTCYWLHYGNNTGKNQMNDATKFYKTRGFEINSESITNHIGTTPTRKSGSLSQLIGLISADRSVILLLLMNGNVRVLLKSGTLSKIISVYKVDALKIYTRCDVSLIEERPVNTVFITDIPDIYKEIYKTLNEKLIESS